jgi:hypothetical protein
VFVTVWIGPDENAGYGPPSMSWKPLMEIVGTLSKISFSWKMYG